MKRSKKFEAEMRKHIGNLIRERSLSLETDLKAESLAACIEHGYVTGIQPRKNTRGSYRFEIVDPSVTLSGLYFYDRRRPDNLSRIAILISILALLLSILTAFTPFGDWSREWFNDLRDEYSSQRSSVSQPPEQ